MVQNQGVGRSLMQALVDHFAARNFPGIRLVQAAYHNRSLCLYTKLGFRTREPLSVIQGPPLNAKLPGYEVRPATKEDIAGASRSLSPVYTVLRYLPARTDFLVGPAREA